MVKLFCRKHNLNTIGRSKSSTKESNFFIYIKNEGITNRNWGNFQDSDSSSWNQQRNVDTRRVGVILRLVAIASTLASAVVMATSDQQLQFFTQVAVFNVEYEDFSTLRYFVVINAIACAYFALSIPLAIMHIARSAAKQSRAVLIIMDMVTLGLLMSAASAATAILFLAHNGNNSANWNSICNQFTDFCHRASASLIGSFAAIVILLLLIFMSTAALARN